MLEFINVHVVRLFRLVRHVTREELISEILALRSTILGYERGGFQVARMTTFNEEKERMEFAKKAAKHFAEDLKYCSYGDLAPGSYLALRWGLGNDGVLVLKLDENYESVNYQGLVKQFLREDTVLQERIVERLAERERRGGDHP